MAVNMLNALQEREYNRDIELQKFLLEKKNEYEKYAPFNRVVQLLLGNIPRIEPFVPVKGKKGVIVTERKNAVRAALATDVNTVCINAAEYAISIGDKDLQYTVRFRTTDITNGKDGNVPAIVATITDALTPLVNEEAFREYEITADMLSSLTMQAADFSDLCGKAAVIDTGSSIANDDINNIFKDIRGNIASLRRLLPHFNKTNPSFVKGFNTSAAVDYSSIRHSGIEGIVTDPLTGTPIEGAIITGEGKKKIALTDSKGVYKLIKLKVKDMKITVTATGYDTQVFTIKIVRGRILDCNIELTRKIISLSATA